MASDTSQNPGHPFTRGDGTPPHLGTESSRQPATPIAKVISACTRSDLDTWRHAASHITKRIPARQFIVVVPDIDVPLFQAASPEQYRVLPDSFYASDFAATLEQRMRGASRSRRGWYLQQLLKLCAVNDAQPEDICVIWDGDTIPLRDLRFTDVNNNLIHYCGLENHTPYFQMTERLVGLTKSVPYSFIAQCMPLKAAWVHDFRRSLEQRHGVNWLSAIIGAIDFSLDSGFSEYETLGTFFWTNYRPRFHPNHRRWSRHGKALVGTPANLTRWWARLLLHRYDYVSFEKWESEFCGDLPQYALAALHNAAPRLERGLRRLAGRFRLDDDARVRRFLAGYFQSPLPKYVVQVGANDGEQNDPLRIHLQKPGNYTALLLEPLPFYVTRLNELYTARSDISVLQAAAGELDAQQTLFYIDPAVADRMNGDGPPNNWAHGQGSFDRGTVEHWICANAFRGKAYVDAIPEYLQSILSINVSIVPLAAVMRECDNTLLCVDVQGRELDVLRGVDWSHSPRYVMFEDDLEGESAVAQFLVARGYRYVCGRTDKVFEHAATKSRPT